MTLLLLLLACGGQQGPANDPTEAGNDTSDSAGVDTADTADSADSADTAPVADADGDGHLATTRGGDDCDDADAWTYPGADEWCDPVDHDCDGEALAPAVCDKAQRIEAVGDARIRTFDTEGLYLAQVLGDLDGDGDAELGILNGVTPNYGPHPKEAWAVLSGPLSAGDLDQSELVDRWIVSDMTEVVNWRLPAGDFRLERRSPGLRRPGRGRGRSAVPPGRRPRSCLGVGNVGRRPRRRLLGGHRRRLRVELVLGVDVRVEE